MFQFVCHQTVTFVRQVYMREGARTVAGYSERLRVGRDMQNAVKFSTVPVYEI